MNSLATQNFNSLRSLHEFCFNQPDIEQEALVEYIIEWKKYRDRECLKPIVLSHMKLVYKLTVKYCKNVSMFMDAFNNGLVGLLESINTYDILKKNAFNTYSSFYIKHRIIRYCVDNYGLFKMVTTKEQLKLFFNKNKLYNLMNNYSENAVNQIATDLNVSVKSVNEMALKLIDSEVFDINSECQYDDGYTYAEVLCDVDSDPLQICICEEEENLLLKLRKSVEELDGIEFDIISNRYMVDVKKPLKYFANKYGISNERVRQYEEIAIKKLKIKMNKLDIKLGEVYEK